jgi:ABC-2 family transporter protein
MSRSLGPAPVLRWHGYTLSALLILAMLVALWVAWFTLQIENGNRSGALLSRTSFTAVTFGLLLLSATAPTTLTEERERGSLDVLMSTPLATHNIVLGKWWATYRRTLPMLVLPGLAGLFVAGTCLDYPSWAPAQMIQMAKPITIVDRVRAGILPTALFLVHSAGVTSFGLALAIWFNRTGRAVAISLAAFVVMSIGWIVAVEAAVAQDASLSEGC